MLNTGDLIAILQRDIARFRLPPQRVKTTDSRASKFLKRFGTRTVELDALPPDELRRRIREAIRSHIDDDAWQKTLLLEKRERESLAAYAKGWSLSS